MSTDDRRPPVPTSVPPESSGVVPSWDDETVPGLDLDDPLNEFDRVTAIPDVPPELYAKRVMASVEDSRVPPPPPEQTAQTAPTARPAAPNRSPPPAAPAATEAVTARPAAPDSPPSSSGLELADLTLDSVSTLVLQPERALEPKGRDPRDPVLELELDGLTTGPFSAPQTVPDDPAITEMKDRYAMGDFTGALVIAEGILEANPEDLETPRYAQSCRAVLTQMYSARLGSLDQCVRMAVPNDQIRWLTLDHRAGFLLSLIDGGSTVDQILDISGMPRLDALRIMYQLLDQRVIALGS